MLEAQFPSLQELKERNDTIIEQIYSVLTNKDIEQEHYDELSFIIEESISTLKKIDDLKNKEENQQIVIEQTLKELQLHQEEVNSMLAFSEQTSKRIANEKNAAINFFIVCHQYSTEMKKATLFKKSISLLQRQIQQLQRIKEKHEKLHNQKTMFTELQLNKEKEEARSILEQIKHDNNEKLRKLKEKRDMVVKELNRREHQYKARIQQYEGDLLKENQNQIKSILSTEQNTKAKKINKTPTNDVKTVQTNKTIDVRPFQTQVINIKQDNSHLKHYVYALLIATAIIFTRIFTK